MLHEIFNLKRFSHYLKKEIFLIGKQSLLGTGALFIIMLIIFSITGLRMPDQAEIMKVHMAIFSFFILFGGFIYTAQIFKDLNNPGNSYFFLTLPSSNFEKFLTALIISSLGFSLLYTGTFLIYVGVANEIHSLVHEINFVYFDFEKFNLLQPLQSYWVGQSIFLLGAIAFKSKNFIKTSVSIFIILLIGLAAISLLGTIFIHPVHTVDHLSVNSIFKSYKLGLQKDWDTIKTVINWATLYLLAPVLWITAYFKLKEREI